MKHFTSITKQTPAKAENLLAKQQQIANWGGLIGNMLSFNGWQLTVPFWGFFRAKWDGVA